jgi:2-keto-4-pentenoate hydratase/2-oxohepta-3-ene-1,7-dioic acid hydratase in catechol pathway
MRLATYLDDTLTGSRLGLVAGDRVVDVVAAAREFAITDCPHDMVGAISGGTPALDALRAIETRASDAPSHALGDVGLRAPFLPARNIVCVGLNYAEHVAESQSVGGAGAPKYPVFFTKPPTTVIGPGDDIPWHGHISTAIDWEAELAVIIGRQGRDIDEASALDYVFGYAVANDVTARDLQQRHAQWYKGKSLDGFCPFGPVVVTADEIADPQALDIALRVNGITKQSSNTRHMIFTVARLIAEWSAGMTLLPGDVLLTGTPAGTGIGQKPPECLKPGDTVEAEVERIGVLRNAVGSAN